jgi:hypothetical protein
VREALRHSDVVSKVLFSLICHTRENLYTAPPHLFSLSLAPTLTLARLY